MPNHDKEARSYDTDAGTTLLQGSLNDPDISALEKYQRINVGRSSWWSLVGYELYTMFLAPLPGAAGYVLRRMALKRLLGSMGKGVIVGRNVTIRHPGKIHLGAGVAVDDYAVLDAKGDNNQGIFVGENVMVGRSTVLSCKDGDLHIGDNTNIAMSCFIQSARTVTIGSKVLFGAYCYVIGGGDHVSERTDIPVMDQGQVIRGITIEDHTWLGADVKVVDGVRIGRDAIIGAGAVVNRDVPAWHIAAGIPARVLRDRRTTPGGESEQ
ncbi:MAG: acyltransferase [Gammaproteobacteria bacterium]|nr:acyltransferase [Gammaproteobacteria bacterium]